MEPDAFAVKHEANYVRESAGAETSALSEVDVITDFALEPFFFVDIDGHCGVTAFRDSAATTRVAVGEVCAMLDDIEGASIGTNYALTV
jgi:hypothetical protein